MRATIDWGIDLGTSNSAIALQDGATPRLVPADDDGGVLLPSAVHVGPTGERVVGRTAAARRFTDPANTAVEFKRLMGTTEAVAFPGCGKTYTPVELSAEILRALTRRAEPLEGGPVRAAVITVPAMFQLGQCEATRAAAALAGIEHAPLLQEPIAAAMAHAGAGHARDGHWLVYDLGGGTFDVSLVRARAGRLQVVDHDGDNHLGGKDFNRLLARWAADRIREGGRLGEFRRTDPALAVAFGRLTADAERVRVALSDAGQAAFDLSDLARSPASEQVDVRLDVDRGLFESLIDPTVRRTTSLCRTLLDRNRVRAADLKGVVLVGGPTRTPLVAAALQRDLGLTVAHVLDPTTIVAVGAALFAATQKRPASLRAAAGPPPAGTVVVDLEFEPMTTNPAPKVVGRVTAGAGPGLTVRVRREDGGYESEPAAVNDAGAFAVPLRLRPGELNVFRVSAARNGEPVPCEPTTFAILHGLSVAKPPLSQSVGVALADNSVCWYLRKGAVLPARNTVTHATTVPLARGQSGDAIRVPLVQGESDRANRNTVIGVLVIHPDQIARDLPAGSAIEVTLTVDEFSRTTAQGFVPLLNQRFDEVARFQSGGQTADQVTAGLDEQKDRLKKLEEQAAALEATGGGSLDGRMKEVEQLIGEGDRDSVDLAGQMVRVMTRQLDQAEGAARATQLTAEFAQKLGTARNVLPPDQMEEVHALEREFKLALDRYDIAAAEARLEALSELVFRAFTQMPEFWKFQFEMLYQKFEELNMVSVAQAQFQEGLAALNRGPEGMQDLVRVCIELYALLPKDERTAFEAVVSTVTGGGSA